MNSDVIAGLIAQAKRSPVLSGKKYKIKKASTRNGTTIINATFVVGRMRSSRDKAVANPEVTQLFIIYNTRLT